MNHSSEETEVPTATTAVLPSPIPTSTPIELIMELNSSSHHISNCRFATSDGSLAFRIETSSISETQGQTMVSSENKMSGDRPIGSILWTTGEMPRIILLSSGAKMDSCSYMRGPKSGSSRRWTAGDGQEYEWKFKEAAELFTTSPSPIRIAYVQKSSSKFKKQKPKLIVEPEATHILDSIILAQAYMQTSLGAKKNWRCMVFKCQYHEDCALI